MHRSFNTSLLCLSLVAALAACSKEKPKSAETETAKTEQEKHADESEAGEQVTSSPTPAKPEAPVESAPEASAPVKAPELVAGTAAAAVGEAAPSEAGEKAAPKPDEEAAAGAEESGADGKKSGKKKSGEKTAEAPAKETKPKFTELGIEVTKPGSGTAATAGKHVTIHYKASLADAEKPFDSTFTSNRPLEVELGAGAKLQVIEGLRRGLEGLMPGSEVRLKIPANLAWGEKGNPAVGVPANADIVFDLQVLDVH